MTWERINLGDLAEFKNGINFDRSNFGRGIKVINVSDFKDHLVPRYEELGEINPDGVVREGDYLEKNDILFVRSNGNKALVGRSMFIDQDIVPTTFSGFVIRCRLKSGNVHPKFFAYLFKTSIIRSELANSAVGTNISNLNQRLLSSLQVPLPPLPTQQKIASILSAYDDLIENNQKRIQFLEEIIHVIYREWFAKRDRSSEQVDVSKDGKLSHAWKREKLVEISTYLGRGITPSYKSGSGLFAINQKANKGILLDETHFKEYDPDVDYPKERYAHTGDLLINSLGEGTIGRVHYFSGVGDKYPVDQHMTILRPVDVGVGLYTYCFLSSPEGQGVLQSIKKGGTNMTMLNIGDLRNLEITVPPSKSLQAFGTILKPVTCLKQNLIEQNKRLANARDLLLPRLMDGSIEV